MIIKTKEGELLLTEIKNINGSLMNDKRLEEHFIKGIKELNFSEYKKEYFGVIVQDFGTYFKTDFTDVRNTERYNKLFEMFDEDKKYAMKLGRKLSIFLIR